MKKIRIRGKYAEPLIDTLEKAGYEFAGRRHGSHLAFAAPDRPTVFVPSDLGDKKVATKIARAAGLTLDG